MGAETANLENRGRVLPGSVCPVAMGSRFQAKSWPLVRFQGGGGWEAWARSLTLASLSNSVLTAPRPPPGWLPKSTALWPSHTLQAIGTFVLQTSVGSSLQGSQTCEDRVSVWRGAVGTRESQTRSQRTGKGSPTREKPAFVGMVATPVTLALRRLRQEDLKFQVTWAT